MIFCWLSCLLLQPMDTLLVDSYSSSSSMHLRTLKKRSCVHEPAANLTRSAVTSVVQWAEHCLSETPFSFFQSSGAVQLEDLRRAMSWLVSWAILHSPEEWPPVVELVHTAFSVAWTLQRPSFVREWGLASHPGRLRVLVANWLAIHVKLHSDFVWGQSSVPWNSSILQHHGLGPIHAPSSSRPTRKVDNDDECVSYFPTSLLRLACGMDASQDSWIGKMQFALGAECKYDFRSTIPPHIVRLCEDTKQLRRIAALVLPDPILSSPAPFRATMDMIPCSAEEVARDKEKQKENEKDASPCVQLKVLCGNGELAFHDTVTREANQNRVARAFLPEDKLVEALHQLEAQEERRRTKDAFRRWKLDSCRVPLSPSQQNSQPHAQQQPLSPSQQKSQPQLQPQLQPTTELTDEQWTRYWNTGVVSPASSPLSPSLSPIEMGTSSSSASSTPPTSPESDGSRSTSTSTSTSTSIATSMSTNTSLQDPKPNPLPASHPSDPESDFQCHSPPFRCIVVTSQEE